MRKKMKIYDISMVPEYYYPGYQNRDRYTHALRAIHMAARTNGVLLLPRFKGSEDYLTQQEIIFDDLEIRMPQVILIDGDSYVYDDDINTNLEAVMAQLPESEMYEVVSFARTSKQDKWVHTLKDRDYEISQALPLRVHYSDPTHPSHRGGWARSVTNPDNESFPEKYELPYPVAWVGTGIDQIIEAYDRVVDQTGSSRVYFKPVYTSGGDASGMVSSEEELRNLYYDLSHAGLLHTLSNGQERTETAVEMQAEIPDIREFASFQYDDSHIITPGDLSRQLITSDGHWYGNSFNFGISRTDRNDASKLSKKILASLRQEIAGDFYGFGGVDLAVTKHGLRILEHNGARMTAVHPVIAATENLHAESKAFTFIKWRFDDVMAHVSLINIWQSMKDANLHYDVKKRTGIVPIVWTEGDYILLYVHDSHPEVEKLIADFNGIIEDVHGVSNQVQ